jgi:hypothetical protein
MTERELLAARAKRKLLEAVKAILNYVEKKEPKTLPEAHHMLALIGIICRETLAELELERRGF